MMLAHLGEAPPSIRGARPELPATLEAVLQRCLAKEPQDRYENARAFDDALTSVLGDTTR